MKRKFWYLIGLFLLVLIAACRAVQSSQVTPIQPITADSFSLHIIQQPTPTPDINIVAQVTQLTATPTVKPPPPKPTLPPQQTVPPGPPSPTNIASTGTGPAPYGPPPPMTAEEIQLTQQLFALINHDRAIRGLYPFVWNNTLAGGARLHSWNMVHCGFSHTCPDGLPQCDRIANEGFTFTDCGENIALAGPYPTPWGGVYNVQESMINEPPTGWHRIHLTSTTLHSIGVGVYVDSRGWLWFTEDMVS